MRYAAVLLALCAPASRLPGNIEAVPGISYGESLSGPDGSYGAVSVTFVRMPELQPERPAPGVVGLQPFPDDARVGVPEGPDPDPEPAGPIIGGRWLWVPEGVEPPSEAEAPVASAGDEVAEAPGSAVVSTDAGIETPWGSMSLAALTAILGTLGAMWGLRRARGEKGDA